jgi:uncharacterized protein
MKLATLVFGAALILFSMPAVAGPEKNEDQKMLLELFEEAKKGSTQAQEELKSIFETPFGLPDNAREAFQFWIYGAEVLGVAEAQHELGLLYAEGRGVRRDYIAAYKWLFLSEKKFNFGDPSRRKAVDNRMLLEKDMTAGDIFKARRLVREWKEKNK